MIRRLFVLSAPLLTAVCLCAAGPAVTPESIVRNLSTADSALSWDGLKLGMTLNDVQILVGTALTLSAGSEGVKTIDRYATPVTRHGVKADLTFESDSPEAALIFIRAAYPAGSKADRTSLEKIMKEQAPALEPVDGSQAMMMPGTDFQAEIRPEGLQLGANWLF